MTREELVEKLKLHLIHFDTTIDIIGTYQEEAESILTFLQSLGVEIPN